MSEILSRQPSEVTQEVRVRRLAYSDLPAVIAIERRSFPTPWSLAMFVLELSKPSGICLAATAGDELLGYLVCSRYDQVWHLMNVAVAPERRRARGRRPLIARLFEEARGILPFTLEVRVSNRAGDRHVRALRLPLGRRPPPLLPRQRRGRADHVAGLMTWLIDETSCDDTCAAVLDGARILSNVISSQAAAREASAASCRRSPPATTSS